MMFLADMVDWVNKEIGDPHAAIGPSYFLLKDIQNLSESEAEHIWKYSILPSIADRFFDKPEELMRFSYSSVRNRAPDETVSAAKVANDPDDNPTADAD
jgi:hypothetical protein